MNVSPSFPAERLDVTFYSILDSSTLEVTPGLVTF